MDELTRKALVEQIENVIEDYDCRELSEVEIELNREQLACISECLQFGQLKGRTNEMKKEIEDYKSALRIGNGYDTVGYVLQVINNYIS